MKIEIRRATLKDRDALIILRYLLTDYESNLKDSNKLDRKIVMRECRYMIGDLQNKDIALFLAYYGNMPIGYSKIKIKRINKELVGHIGADFVLKEFRQRGIGRKLVNKMEEFVKSKKISKISVELYKSNKGSLVFHKKIGFNLVEDNPNKKIYRLEKNLK